MKVGFIGAGNMGSALASAASRTVGVQLYISDTDEIKCKALADSLNARVSTNKEIAGECDYIFLAVKPQHIASVIDEFKDGLGSGTIVSMAAGVSLEKLEAYFGKAVPIIRIMPNTPVAVGSGVILSSPNELVTKEAKDNFLSLLKYAGEIDIIDEELIDAGTAVSGCSPAFVYMFIDALAKGGAEAGLDRDKAQLYAAKTLIGAASLLLETGKTPEELRIAVCSPGGSTIEGVRALESGNLYGLVSGAVKASYEKTKILGK